MYIIQNKVAFFFSERMLLKSVSIVCWRWSICFDIHGKIFPQSIMTEQVCSFPPWQKSNDDLAFSDFRLHLNASTTVARDSRQLWRARAQFVVYKDTFLQLLAKRLRHSVIF